VTVAVLPVVRTVDDVAGNVIVVPSVPASARELLAVSNFPEAIEIPMYCAVQLAAVVGVATTAVKIAEVPPARITIVFKPED